MIKASFLILACALLASTVSARPLAIIPDEPSNYAWFARDLKLIPIDNNAAGVSLEKVNQERGMDRLCFLEEFSMDSFVALDRKTQLKVYETLFSFEEYPFRIEFKAGDLTYTAQAAAYEDCFGATGSIIVVADKKMDRVTLIEPNADKVFLYPSVDAAFGFSTCLECGDQRAVYFDSGRETFYVVQEGD